MLSRKPWRAEFVLLLGAAQIFCFFAGAVVISSLHKLGIAGFKNENDFGNILLATLCFQGATWILIPIFLRLNGICLREMFGLNLWNFFRALALAVAAVIVALGLEYAYELVLQKIGWHPKSQTAVELLNNAPLWPTGIYLAIFAVVLAPVAEEFIFRGVLFPFVKNLGFPRLAWIGVSLLFALIHVDAAIFIPLFVLALMLTWLYEKTENLLAPVIAHALFNATNLVMLIHQNQ
jgi:membrane protease YdiL (CAAX protease family)